MNTVRVVGLYHDLSLSCRMSSACGSFGSIVGISRRNSARDDVMCDVIEYDVPSNEIMISYSLASALNIYHIADSNNNSDTIFVFVRTYSSLSTIDHIELSHIMGISYPCKMEEEKLLQRFCLDIRIIGSQCVLYFPYNNADKLVDFGHCTTETQTYLPYLVSNHINLNSSSYGVFDKTNGKVALSNICLPSKRVWTDSFDTHSAMLSLFDRVVSPINSSLRSGAFDPILFEILDGFDFVRTMELVARSLGVNLCIIDSRLFTDDYIHGAPKSSIHSRYHRNNIHRLHTRDASVIMNYLPFILVVDNIHLAVDQLKQQASFLSENPLVFLWKWSRMISAFLTNIQELWDHSIHNNLSSESINPIHCAVIGWFPVLDRCPIYIRQLFTSEYLCSSREDKSGILQYLAGWDISKLDVSKDCCGVRDLPELHRKMMISNDDEQSYGYYTMWQLYREACQDSLDCSNKHGNDVTRTTNLPWTMIMKSLPETKKCLLTPKHRNVDISLPSLMNPCISPVLWEDIGGLHRIRQEILTLIDLPLKYPGYFQGHDCRRKGLLLFGPPGTGKTLVAKAIATECNLQFFSIKGPELLDMYVGESEKNIREVFALAKSRSPSVLFFDELDSLAPARSRNSDSSGGSVMDRLVSQLLTEFDVLDQNPENFVFVIGATNRPDLLDPALLRPGRLDRKIYLSACQSIEQKADILRAQCRNYKMHSNLDFLHLATLLPAVVTGADLAALSQSAFQIALKKKLHQWCSTSQQICVNNTTSSLEHSSQMTVSHSISDEDKMNDFFAQKENVYQTAAYVNSLPSQDLEIVISLEDFQQVLMSGFSCSVSVEELLEYDKIGERFDSNWNNHAV